MSLWVVRAGRHGEQEATALDKGVVAIGWGRLGDLSGVKTRQGLQDLYTKATPGVDKWHIANHVGQIWRFLKEIQPKDLVALPLKNQGGIAVGLVEGDYVHQKISSEVEHWRKVKWLKTLPRTAFDQDILYSMGAIMTVFEVSRNDAEKRVRKLVGLAKGSEQEKKEESEPTGEGAVDIEEYAQDQLLKFIEKKLKGHALSRLVDGVLRAQGYQTEVSPPGADGGVDILAGSGLLGFDPPRLCVQVKSSASPAGQTVFNELMGVMAKYKAEQGLFVSWGGFTDAVRKDSKKEYFSIRLWDQGDLVDAVLANYEKLDDEIKAELPLKRIWVLVGDEEP